jgi:hypothetical protein
MAMVRGAEGKREPTLLIKAESLLLRYLMMSDTLDLVVIRSGVNSAIFAVDMKDDPEDPSMTWSYVESDDESLALRLALEGNRCEVFLFNELAVNVAHAAFSLRVTSGDGTEFMEATAAVDDGYEEARRTAAREAFGMWRKGQSGVGGTVIAKGESITAWTENYASYVRNFGGISELRISTGNEGWQQEELAVWLVDNLHPAGVVHNPQVEESGRRRELTDLLLSYSLGCLFVESKSLQILGRPVIPDRKRLSRDLIKHVEKAAKQLTGAVRSVRRGLSIFDEAGVEVAVSVDQPPHLIVLVPDLSLLSGVTQFGSSFFVELSRKNQAFFHILDPVELLRFVQAAEMSAKASREPVTEMEAFDFYLMERAKRTRNAVDPNLRVLFR